MAEVVATGRSSGARLEVSIPVDAPPQAVWRAFVDPVAITTWWADEATTDPVVGGLLEARWPAMGWTMRGRYLELDPGRAVAFTWSWLHEPDAPERIVRVTLSADREGTEVTVSHGDYGPDDAEERTEHLEGWQHFLPRLAGSFES